MANQGKGGARVNHALQKNGQWAERIPSAPLYGEPLSNVPLLGLATLRHSGVGYEIDRRFMAESSS